MKYHPLQGFLREGLLRSFALIDLDPQSRCFQWKPKSVLSFDGRFHYLEAPNHVTKHILLNKKIRGAQSEMKRSGVGDGAVWVVGRNSHVVRLAQICNPARLSKATAVVKIGL